MDFDRLLLAEHRLSGSVRARSEVYENVHRAARDLLPFDAFYLCLYEPKNRRLRFEYNGDDDGLDTPEAFALGNGPTSRAVLTRKAQVLNHLREEASSTVAFGNSDCRSRGTIHLPFWDGAPGMRGIGSPLGVISVQSYSLDAYGRPHVAALRWLSARAANLLRETETEAARQADMIAREEALRTKLIVDIESIVGNYGLGTDLRNALLSAVRYGSPPRCRLDTERLTDRELQAVALASEGLTYGRIADVLGIGAETVKTHLRRAYAKIGIADRRSLPGHVAELLMAVASRKL